MLSTEELKLIKSSFLFADCKESELNEFFKNGECSVCFFKKGESIILGGKEEKRLGILLSGKASATCNEGGKGALKVFLKGELFGAASVFCRTGIEPFSKMKALSNCRVFFITKSGIERLLSRNPERALSYISFLSDRVAFLNRRISTFTSREAVSRVAKHIIDNADENSVCKNVNFSALAKSLDISRASLYRAKSELIELNAIAVENKDVIILDRKALKNIS